MRVHSAYIIYYECSQSYVIQNIFKLTSKQVAVAWKLHVYNNNNTCIIRTIAVLIFLSTLYFPGTLYTLSEFYFLSNAELYSSHSRIFCVVTCPVKEFLYMTFYDNVMSCTIYPIIIVSSSLSYFSSHPCLLSYAL